MELKTYTVQECAADFVENVWPHLFKGSRGSKNREWAKVRAFVIDVKAGRNRQGRTIDFLKEYGGGRYEIGVTCKINKTE